jgi:hypothetical protein
MTGKTMATKAAVIIRTFFIFPSQTDKQAKLSPKHYALIDDENAPIPLQEKVKSLCG